jgi:hypothetical protein
VFLLRVRVNGAPRKVDSIARGTPERARIDPVRIDLKHLVEEFSGCRRGLGYAVEIADGLPGLFDDPGAIVVFSPLMSRDHRGWTERLDSIQGGNLLQARVRMGLGETQVDAVVNGVTRCDQAD